MRRETESTTSKDVSVLGGANSNLQANSPLGPEPQATASKTPQNEKPEKLVDNNLMPGNVPASKTKEFNLKRGDLPAEITGLQDMSYDESAMSKLDLESVQSVPEPPKKPPTAARPTV